VQSTENQHKSTQFPASIEQCFDANQLQLAEHKSKWVGKSAGVDRLVVVAICTDALSMSFDRLLDNLAACDALSEPIISDRYTVCHSH